MKYLIEFVGDTFTESGDVSDPDSIQDRMIEMVEGGDESDYDFWWNDSCGYEWLCEHQMIGGKWVGNNLSITIG